MIVIFIFSILENSKELEIQSPEQINIKYKSSSKDKININQKNNHFKKTPFEVTNSVKIDCNYLNFYKKIILDIKNEEDETTTSISFPFLRETGLQSIFLTEKKVNHKIHCSMERILIQEDYPFSNREAPSGTSPP